jgi:ligand-binding SRPBCC domain-containing protein
MSNNPKIKIESHSTVGFELTAELVIDRPLEEVFDFFSDAGNLEAITPPWLNFRIVTPMPLEMKKGALIDYRLQLHGLPIKWRTEIEAWQPPRRFVDQQLRGPYKKWYHEHTFEALSPNQTLAKDRVHYIPRFGSLVHKYFVKPDLMKIFSYRQEQLVKHFTTLPAPSAGFSMAESTQVLS